VKILPAAAEFSMKTDENGLT